MPRGRPQNGSRRSVPRGPTTRERGTFPVHDREAARAILCDVVALYSGCELTFDGTALKPIDAETIRTWRVGQVRDARALGWPVTNSDERVPSLTGALGRVAREWPGTNPGLRELSLGQLLRFVNKMPTRISYYVANILENGMLGNRERFVAALYPPRVRAARLAYAAAIDAAEAAWRADTPELLDGNGSHRFNRPVSGLLAATYAKFERKVLRELAPRERALLGRRCVVAHIAAFSRLERLPEQELRALLEAEFAHELRRVRWERRVYGPMYGHPEILDPTSNMCTVRDNPGASTPRAHTQPGDSAVTLYRAERAKRQSKTGRTVTSDRHPQPDLHTKQRLTPRELTAPRAAPLGLMPPNPADYSDDRRALEPPQNESAPPVETSEAVDAKSR